MLAQPHTAESSGPHGEVNPTLCRSKQLGNLSRRMETLCAQLTVCLGDGPVGMQMMKVCSSVTQTPDMGGAGSPDLCAAHRITEP